MQIKIRQNRGTGLNFFFKTKEKKSKIVFIFKQFLNS